MSVIKVQTSDGSAAEVAGTNPCRSVESAAHWKRIARLLLTSRAIDYLEETRLAPEKKVFNQFSARGHDFAQILLGTGMQHPYDAASGYYRSRPFVLSLGLSIEDALAAPLATSGSYSDGRDIGVVCNYPNFGKGCSLIPMSGGVGAQFTPITGWAQSVQYHQTVLENPAWKGAVALSMGGDASLSTSGFWSALNIATTHELPQLFYIEDNGYGISVPSAEQTPGGDQIANLSAYRNLKIVSGDGTDPLTTPALIEAALSHVRSGAGCALLRLKVPRLCGHTFQDNQNYKPDATRVAEDAQDPMPKLQEFLADTGILSCQAWHTMESETNAAVEDALEKALARPGPDTAGLTRYVFAAAGTGQGTQPAIMGGQSGLDPRTGSALPEPQGQRINMSTAIRRTLAAELVANPRVLVFGEDVGVKGGVHGVTQGLNSKFGSERVFDTSLSEEGIIGRSVGMALSGLRPVPEIQFRKYAEPAAEQLSDTGTMRWRTHNRFAAPMVVRIPGGFAKRGDPWHSMCDEVEWVHKVGWQLAFPSNAEDAVGLLRFALRDDNPSIFFEHRALYDSAYARRPYPGDDYVLPFGQARRVTSGDALTLVCWGAMVERAERAAEDFPGLIEVIDLRTLVPWDRETVLDSVRRNGRCLIVHEDNLSAGFGAEIAAVLAKEAFFDLDTPIERLAMPDIPSPHNIDLLNAALPTSDSISRAIQNQLAI